MDETDFKIINALIENSRMTMRALAEKVHLTAPAAAARVQKLEDSGVIEGYTVKVNQSKIGLPIHAFITIMTDSPQHQSYLDFLKGRNEYIVNNFKISGEGCYMLEGRFPSYEETNDFLKALNNHANYKLAIVIDK